MKIHREGIPIIFIIFFILSGLCLLFWFLLPLIFAILLTVVAVAVEILVVTFFRSPERHVSVPENAILSPADGEVVMIQQVFEKEFFHQDMLRISIFMSVYNVHLNRIPVSGKVIYKRYHPGRYLLAFHDKSSELNERNTVVIETSGGKKLMTRQIAGAVARRIRCYVKEGDTVTQGNELGFIKFGSRLDLFLPPGTTVSVGVGEKVYGKMSVMGYFN